MRTSNYFKTKGLNKGVLVGISCGVPDWYTGQLYKDLAPSAQLLGQYRKGLIGDEEYTKRYLEKISKLDPQMIYDTIASLAGFDAVLLCWCKVGDFCHRRIAAEWLQEKLGVIIPEMGREPEGFHDSHDSPDCGVKNIQTSFLDEIAQPQDIWPD